MSTLCLRKSIRAIHFLKPFHSYRCNRFLSSSLSNLSKKEIIAAETSVSLSNHPEKTLSATILLHGHHKLVSNEQPLLSIPGPMDKFDSTFEINLDPFSDQIDPEALGLFVPAPKPTFNLAALANKEPIIRHLIHLGVDLAEMEKDRQKAEFIMTLNFDQDVQPYLRFLQKTGLPFNRLGQFLTSNLEVLKEPLQNLRVRIEYLRRKQFSNNQIVDILLRFPTYLSVPVLTVDAQLAHYQKQLQLKASEVREMLVRFPRMVRLHHMHLQEIRFALKEEMGFSTELVKQILVKRPGLMRRGKLE